CDTFSIDENESFLRQQTPQARCDGAIAATETVLGASGAHLLRQIGKQVRRIADAQFFNVRWPIRVDWIWPDLFRCGNVRPSKDDGRPSNDDALNFRGRTRCRLTDNVGTDQQHNTDGSNQGYLICRRREYPTS